MRIREPSMAMAPIESSRLERLSSEVNSVSRTTKRSDWSGVSGGMAERGPGFPPHRFSHAGISGAKLGPHGGTELFVDERLHARDGLKRFLDQAALQVGERTGTNVVAERASGARLLQLQFEAQQGEELERFE